jgi:hypothetical protein
LTNAGGGFTLKAPKISSITSNGSSGAVITCALNLFSVGSLVITNGGSNYSTTPILTFKPVRNRSGASATATINLGIAATLNCIFNKTLSYAWNGIPPLVMNDLARFLAINIMSTNFNTKTPYTYKISGLLYDSRDSFFSDYGQPILSSKC